MRKSQLRRSQLAAGVIVGDLSERPVQTGRLTSRHSPGLRQVVACHEKELIEFSAHHVCLTLGITCKRRLHPRRGAACQVHPLVRRI